MKTPRHTIQIIIKSLLCMIIFSSSYLPLILTAYFALMYTFLHTYNYVSMKETNDEITYDAENNKMAQNRTNQPGTPALVFGVLVQVISLGAAFLLTWFVLEKKMKYFL